MVVIRRMLTNILDADPDIEVIGSAPNGKLAVDKITQLSPDLITMDIEMPVMDGITATKKIREINKTIPILLFSTLTEKGAKKTIEGLHAGATDYVTKPSNTGGLIEGMKVLREELIPKIKNCCSQLLVKGFDHPVFGFAKISVTEPTLKQRISISSRIDMICIGSSTGGPNALTELFGNIPKDFHLPILLVQHMPESFTPFFVDRLNINHNIEFKEATNGGIIKPGTVYVAPGGIHMLVKKQGTQLVTQLEKTEPIHSCRPAVDAMLVSLSSIHGINPLSVILTGMGRDGSRGTALLHERGHPVIVQDKETSIVWGMPGVVAEEGNCDIILPITEIGPEILRQAGCTTPSLASP